MFSRDFSDHGPISLRKQAVWVVSQAMVRTPKLWLVYYSKWLILDDVEVPRFWETPIWVSTVTPSLAKSGRAVVFPFCLPSKSMSQPWSEPFCCDQVSFARDQWLLVISPHYCRALRYWSFASDWRRGIPHRLLVVNNCLRYWCFCLAG